MDAGLKKEKGLKIYMRKYPGGWILLKTEKGGGGGGRDYMKNKKSFRKFLGIFTNELDESC